MEKINDLFTLMNQVRHRLGWDEIDTNASLMTYLKDEVNELDIEIQANHAQGIQDELMDVLFVCLALVHDNKIDLAQALKQKLDDVVVKYESR